MGVTLRVESLEHYYGDTPILTPLSFQVFEGEFLSILGPSGCGKTTLLNILIGLLEPTRGKIYAQDQDITTCHPSQRGMGIVFQNYALFQNMTVLENVSYALKFQKETKTKAKSLALDAIAQVGMMDYCHMKPQALSGGQQQRVAIARTLSQNPRILLFDEPLSALDIENRLLLREEIKKIQNKFHSTMIYVTHDQEEAFTLSDRIMVMEKGKIAQLGTPQEILSTPANQYVEDFVVKNLQKKLDSLKKALDFSPPQKGEQP